jgi:hypothetical protein
MNPEIVIVPFPIPIPIPILEIVIVPILEIVIVPVRVEIYQQQLYLQELIKYIKKTMTF